ncbi:Hypothetical protein CpCap5W_0187 [Corynebacterium pseudotuberculosis]|nr:Hypothetical protein Cp3995_0173 [Corynebacterium pseudotuberculosis 3/99-5]AFH51088.1 Hypothetical protein Cp267_0180 [Corynebacterium pseudotuberculosis 267]AIG06530.1 hypothetical protein CPTA_00701 [Corynebacterium pseudotuberculosis]AIG08888.1 hypothetical protein CPTB_00832 [Corynebacterium pseudotuberculosis]AIG10782.1 hypothetical protein CPTC_00494 [Corynebacterium pseudotuberculosis]
MLRIVLHLFLLSFSLEIPACKEMYITEKPLPAGKMGT